MNIREHCNPAREHCRFGWMLKQLRENADPDHEAEQAEPSSSAGVTVNKTAAPA